MLKNLKPTKNSTISGSKTDAIQSTCCGGCDVCIKECDFLARYGNPGSIVNKYKADPDRWIATSFECSLCGLCTSVCPQALDPATMFQNFRKQAVEKGQGHFGKHQGLINYENKGTSKKYSLYSLPENCDTIFFPGCSLTGTRPDNTLKAYEYLKTHISNIGIVMDCCTKPSHDLGRQDYFDKTFSKLKLYLLENNIQTIIVACPSCHKIFNNYAPEFIVETIYDIMSSKGVEDKKKFSGQVTIHDPCPVRFENKIQDSVRLIVKAKGIEIIDTPHKRNKTFCCGEGGAVGCLSPDLAQGWTKKRIHEAHPHKIVSYCAGCVNLLSKKSDAIHLLDLVFDPEKAMSGNAKVSKAPFTYLNRLKLKATLKNQTHDLSDTS
ncbi:MAG: (Fe-S)-binding protein [Desulfobacteraceae bacterium]|nr:(Fe-S)-binding protein [Desulfobacteraceae bacterium]